MLFDPLSYLSTLCQIQLCWHSMDFTVLGNKYKQASLPCNDPAGSEHILAPHCSSPTGVVPISPHPRVFCTPTGAAQNSQASGTIWTWWKHPAAFSGDQNTTEIQKGSTNNNIRVEQISNWDSAAEITPLHLLEQNIHWKKRYFIKLVRERPVDICHPRHHTFQRN